MCKLFQEVSHGEHVGDLWEHLPGCHVEHSRYHFNPFILDSLKFLYQLLLALCALLEPKQAGVA